MRHGPRKPPISYFALKKSWREWERLQRFPGLMRGIPTKSEVHFLTTLSVPQRRARLKNHILVHYQFRRRGQYVPSMPIRAA